MQTFIPQNIYRQVTVLKRPNISMLEPALEKKIKIEEKDQKQEETKQQTIIWNTQSTSLKNSFMESKIEPDYAQFNHILKQKSDSEELLSTCSQSLQTNQSTSQQSNLLFSVKQENDKIGNGMQMPNFQNIESLKMQLEPLKHQQSSSDSYQNQTSQFNSCDNKNIQLKKLLQSIETQAYDQNSSGKKSFSCPVCQKSYSNKSYLKKHIIELHNTKTFKCEECLQEIETDQVTFNLHVEKCKKNRSCAYCDAKNMNYDQFNQHMIRKHPTQVIQQKNNVETSSILECHICHKQNFKNVNILKQHIKKQHTDVNLTCQYCQKSGFCRTSLQNHYKTSHVFDQKCDQCSQDKLSLDQLQQHKIKHQQENNKNNFYITGMNKIINENIQDNKIVQPASQNIEKQQENFSDLIQRDLNLKQKDLKQKIEEINDKQQYKYALKRSSYTQKINKILGL